VTAALASVAAYFLVRDYRPPAVGWPAADAAPSWKPELLLPDVTGLTAKDPPGAPASADEEVEGEAVHYATVRVDAYGFARLEREKTRSTRRWRGFTIPLKAAPADSRQEPLEELSVNVTRLGFHNLRAMIYRMREWRTTEIRGLAAHLNRLGQIGRYSVTVDAQPAVPFGPVAAAAAAAEGGKHRVEFLPPPVPMTRADTVAWQGLHAPLARMAAGHPSRNGRFSDMGVLVHADVRAPWERVERVLQHCAEAGIWRVSFAVLRRGKETSLGRSGGWPRGLTRPEIIRYRDERRRDIFRSEVAHRPPEVLAPLAQWINEDAGLADIPEM